MTKLDQLINIQNKLEMKKESLQDELSSVDAELKSVQKLRHEAEKIVARLEKQQRKLDQLLEERIPNRKRRSTDAIAVDTKTSQSEDEALSQIEKPVKGEWNEEL